MRSDHTKSYLVRAIYHSIEKEPSTSLTTYPESLELPIPNRFLNRPLNCMCALRRRSRMNSPQKSSQTVHDPVGR